MNLNKHLEFFDPNELNEEIHIIGCGAVGSTIAEQLTRLGIKRLYLYDFDTVSAHNITNQMYLHKHIGRPKLHALAEILQSINPDIELILNNEGWKPHYNLSGYVFTTVDSIETRKQIVQENLFNTNIKAMFDVRIRLTDAQHFAARWTQKEKAFFLSTMNFSSEEAKAQTPVSACGTTLSVTPTVRHICATAVANLINVVTNKGKFAKTVLIDTFNHTVEAYDDNGLIE